MGFKWTKLQDFYLRLGFLKILVLLSDPARRSTSTEALVKRLHSSIFPPLERTGDLWEEVRERYELIAEPESRQLRSGSSGFDLVKALLIASDCPSFLYAITPKTVYKIIDWGRDIGFLGSGNQITENALLLRHFVDLRAADAFFSGDYLSWNPFVLSAEERIFFLFLFGEIDRHSVEVIKSLGQVDPSRTLEARDAGEITCRALFKLLDGAGKVSPLELPRLRAARELAISMAAELGLSEYEHLGVGRRPVAPRLSRRGAARDRRTTKNTDHQTIPRFEQLVDLGFLKKTCEAGRTNAEFLARKRWRYKPTAACRSLLESGWLSDNSPGGETARCLARVAISAGMSREMDIRSKPDAPEIARLLWEAYKTVRRPVGHTPAYSVAVLAVIRAAADGYPIEMSDIHSLLVRVKTQNLAPDHAFFASGNDLDKMFVVLRPGFLETLSKALS
jgi:hypothetical protein